MQYANIMLALGGDRGTTVPKAEMSASEIAVLRLIHGADSVFDVEPVQVDGEKAKRTSREEISRLKGIYGRARIQSEDGAEASVVNVLFPGAAAQAIQNIDDLEIPEEFFKAKTRVSADGGEKEVSDDGLGKMTKADLLEEAEKRGVEVDASAKKADILAALRAADEPADDKTDDELFA